MNQSNRVCKMVGHDELPIFHICTLQQCNKPTRWCCVECIQHEIHNHEKSNNSHVMRTKDLLLKLKNESDRFQKDQENLKKRELFIILEKIVKECLGLEKSIINYRKSIESQIQNITQSQQKFKSYQKNLDISNFEQLDDINLNELLNVNFQQEKQNQQFLPLDNIKQQLYSIECIIKNYQENKNDDFNPIDLKNKKYITQQIDQTNNYYYNASSISKNDKYLAYGGDKQLKVYDIKQRKIIKGIKLDNELMVCQFTNDSSQLYVGQYEGIASGYDVLNNFNEIYKQQIHSSDVYNLITIQNQYLITCSFDQSIIKTDIKSKQQIFKLTGHTSHIYAIDYNDKDEIIVSGSYDKSIKLWNCRNQSIIINEKQSHNNYIIQIQLINKNLNILSLDLGGNLYKWQIDLTNNNLIKLQQFIDQNKIFNFHQVNQDQSLLLICNNYAKILNEQGETINTIEHGGKDGYSWHCRQLDNIKLILIRTQKQIILATALD